MINQSILDDIIKSNQITSSTSAWMAYEMSTPDSFERPYLWQIYTNFRDGRSPNYVSGKKRGLLNSLDTLIYRGQ